MQRTAALVGARHHLPTWNPLPAHPADYAPGEPPKPDLTVPSSPPALPDASHLTGRPLLSSRRCGPPHPCGLHLRPL